MSAPMLADRLRTWLQREELDERLAAGEPPTSSATMAGEPPASSATMALRAERLCSVRVREVFAEGVETAMRAADCGGLDATWLTVDALEVSEARSELEQLAKRLRAPQGIHPRGAAITRLLLVSKESPLHAPSERGALRAWVRVAIGALDGGFDRILDPVRCVEGASSGWWARAPGAQGSADPGGQKILAGAAS